MQSAKPIFFDKQGVNCPHQKGPVRSAMKLKTWLLPYMMACWVTYSVGNVEYTRGKHANKYGQAVLK